QLNVVWYGTSFFDGKTTPDNYPASAAWYVFFAQNGNAAVAGSKFTQVKASPIVHLGGACESGVTCTGNRDLFDDFGVAVSPTTGLASIAYSDDQPGNTSSDDHTAIATQTGGPKICAGTRAATGRGAIHAVIHIAGRGDLAQAPRGINGEVT